MKNKLNLTEPTAAQRYGETSTGLHLLLFRIPTVTASC